MHVMHVQCEKENVYPSYQRVCPAFGLFKFIFNERFLFLFGSFFLFLSGIVHWSFFLKVGLRPAGCASDDFIPDRRRDIAVGCTLILLFALWRIGNILQFVFLPNDT